MLPGRGWPSCSLPVERSDQERDVGRPQQLIEIRNHALGLDENPEDVTGE